MDGPFFVSRKGKGGKASLVMNSPGDGRGTYRLALPFGWPAAQSSSSKRVSISCDIIPSVCFKLCAGGLFPGKELWRNLSIDFLET